MSGEEDEKLFELTIKLLLVSSIAELLLNRMFSRVGIFIPKKGFLMALYNALSTSGVIALNFSFILAAFSLLMVIDEDLKRGKIRSTLIAALVSLNLVLSLAFIFVAPDAKLSIIYSGASLLALLLMALGFFVGAEERIKKYAIAAILLVYLCSYYYKISNFVFQALGSTRVAPFALEIFAQGEASALAASALFFLAYPGINRRAFTIASVLSVIFLAANIVQSKMTAIIVIWSLGYTLFLPYPLYAIAFFFFSYAALNLIFEGKHEGYALALIFIAGYQIPLSYNLFLLLLGFALLTSTPRDSSPRPKPHRPDIHSVTQAESFLPRRS